VIGGDEFAAGTAQLKDMASETATTIAWHGDDAVLVAAVRALLATRGR
jgi:histidyl-tRNA synthetase